MEYGRMWESASGNADGVQPVMQRPETAGHAETGHVANLPVMQRPDTWRKLENCRLCRNRTNGENVAKTAGHGETGNEWRCRHCGAPATSAQPQHILTARLSVSVQLRPFVYVCISNSCFVCFHVQALILCTSLHKLCMNCSIRLSPHSWLKP